MASDPTGNSSGSRTQALAAIERPDDTPRKIALIGCGCVIAIFALIAALLTGTNFLLIFAKRPGIAFVSAILAVVVAVPYTAFYVFIDRNEREPFYLLFGAFFWGAVLATFVSGEVNSAFRGAVFYLTDQAWLSSQLSASISAPLIEEFTKWLAVLVIFLGFSRHFDNVLDGIVYGALAGLGFATFENFLYYVSQPDFGSVFELFWIRGIVKGVGGSHALYTAIAGAGLGLFRVMRTGGLRWAAPPVALGLAMFIHFAWNTFAQFFSIIGSGPAAKLLISMPLAVLILNVPFLIAVLVTVYFNWRFEAKLIRNYLSEELAPVLQPGELDQLVPARRRAVEGIKQLMSGDLSGWWERRRRNNRLVELAFEKWHMDKEAELGDSETAQRHAQRVIELRSILKGQSAS